MLNKIPAELRQFDSWVVWKFEQIFDKDGLPKMTKAPYCAKTGKRASSIDPESWCSLDQARFVFENVGIYDGYGFVLSEADPFSFIDLDYTEDPEEVAFQTQIFEAFNSYAEISPSGKGLHIIVKGVVPENIRTSTCEIYSKEQYMTMTGNVFKDVPIADCQNTLESLWVYLGGKERLAIETEPQQSAVPDDEILDRAASADNASKFQELFCGTWQGFYESQSEADFALIDILAFYSDDKEQVKRLFLKSALGQRDKAKRGKYVETMVKKSFDRKLPPIDCAAVTASVEAEILKKSHRTRDRVVEIVKNPYTPPPGLAGMIAQFLHDAAPRPVPEIALAGALGLLAGISGRAYNVSGTGVNQYVVLLAKTGTGKEAISNGIGQLINEVKKYVPAASEFIGPSFIASPQGLIKRLAKHKSFVSIMGEFGLKLQTMNSRTASANDKGIMTAMLDVFNKSGRGNVMGSSAYSDSDKDVAAVEAPAFSIIGESTPDTFYQAVDESSIRSGLIPRLTIIEYKGDRPDLNRNRVHAIDRPELVNALSKFAAQAAMLNHQNQTVQVNLDSEAERLFEEYNGFVDAKIRGKEDASREVWNRAHIKALKLASLIAIGENFMMPTVTGSVAQWAINVENYNVKLLLDRFDSGEIGGAFDTSEVKQLGEVRRALREWIVEPWERLERYRSGTIQMHSSKIVPYKFLQSRLYNKACFRDDKRGATAAIQKILQMLMDYGDIRIFTDVQKFGTSAKLIAILNPDSVV